MNTTIEQSPSATTEPSQRRSSKTRNLVVAILAAFALLFATPTTAQAATYSESASGQDSITTSTTLYYKNPHGNFNLRIWVTKAHPTAPSDRYSVSFYDNAGRLVWSAANQGDRVYGVGGNVTKIVVQRAAALASAAVTHWQRQ
ncbi:hypothetical protein ACGGZK_11725 [Agromyces sp. MMS24-K17]|uniref:hypothetical protein n=1 Tax=Agromyces sp. MMS24-K17 TaxID=3372850 RepID=UPI0037548E61